MTERARLQIALVGAGAMGSLHARVVSQSQDADLAVVCDPDELAGPAVAERFRTTWVPQLDDFAGCDAVIVAAPTDTHLDWGLHAIEAGLPVLIEKPIADDLADTSKLVDVARTRGVPLMCGLLERFNPAVRTAMSIVSDPVHVRSVRHSPYVPRIGMGVANDLLIHDVDLVLRITGALPTEVTARFGYCHPLSAPGAEDIAEVALQFDGLLASLSASRVSQRKVRTIAISELDRLVEVDMVRQDITVYRHVGDAALDDGPGYRQQTIIDIPTVHDAREPLLSQLERFVSLARADIDLDEELDTLLGPHLVVANVMRAGVSAGVPPHGVALDPG